MFHDVSLKQEVNFTILVNVYVYMYLKNIFLIKPRKRQNQMTTITASAVKELREITGVAMMDCKKALVETNGTVSYTHLTLPTILLV